MVRDDADRVDREATFPEAQVAALRTQGLLGLLSSPGHGGLGGGPREIVDALLALSAACGSTAMVYLMHLSAAAVLEAAPPAGSEDLLRRVATGDALATLAFSERGSRSHFWAPTSRAETDGRRVRLLADKSWVTSANHADVFVVSTLAHDATSPTESELYAVERSTPGIEPCGAFEGVGLRGNDSAPMRIAVELPLSARLGAAGSGFSSMLQVVLPYFSLGNAAVSLGLARSALQAAIAHVTAAGFEHLGSTLADLPTIRAYIAKSWADLTAHEAMLRETAGSVASPGDGTMLAVLCTKAACNEAALRVTDTAMRVAGGAAYSRHLGIERYARDARAGFVMAPTSDVLFDFAGRALCGLDLF